MCRKLLCLLLTFLTLTIIPGCFSGMNFSDDDMDIYKKIHKKYAYMKSYTAKAETTVYSGKTKSKYTVLQYTKEPKMYRTEFLSENEKAELIVVEKNGKISVSSLGSSLNFNSSDIYDCTFINNFFNLYYKSQQTAINVSAQKDSSFILLETDIFPVSKNAKKAVMMLDRNANVQNIKIYDAGGNLYTETVFLEFNYNAEIQDELFD